MKDNSNLDMAFVRTGESGECKKHCGSNNCAYSVYRSRCPGVHKVLDDEQNGVMILCDSTHIGNRSEARVLLTKKVRILRSPRAFAA